VALQRVPDDLWIASCIDTALLLPLLLSIPDLPDIHLPTPACADDGVAVRSKAYISHLHWVQETGMQHSTSANRVSKQQQWHRLQMSPYSHNMLGRGSIAAMAAASVTKRARPLMCARDWLYSSCCVDMQPPGQQLQPSCLAMVAEDLTSLS
jgi:hypothetical protein